MRVNGFSLGRIFERNEVERAPILFMGLIREKGFVVIGRLRFAKALRFFPQGVAGLFPFKVKNMVKKDRPEKNL